MLAAQNMLAHGASGLVLGPVLAPRTLVRVQPLAMVERDSEGYIKEDALGDWTELKKSTARPPSTVIQPTLPDPPSPPRPPLRPLSLSRLTAPHPIQPSTSYISRLQTPHHLQALGATVTEWRDLPEAAQGIVTAVREKPESVEFDDVISGIDAGYDATEVEFEVNGLKSAPGR